MYYNVITSLVTLILINSAKCDSLVVCYYDKNVFYRSDLASFNGSFVHDGVKDCTHLIYGFVGINSQNYSIQTLDPHMDVSYPHYANIVQLKEKFPTLKIFLSVGGNEDEKDPEKYLLLLENEEHMKTFAESAKELLLYHGFDGLDLAWQFPPMKPKKSRGTWSKIWHGIKSIFTSNAEEVDMKYKRGFTNLTLHCKKLFTHHDLRLTMTLLPNVNTTAFVDVLHVIRNVDFANLLAFDFYTPERNPKEADYPAPLFAASEDDPHSNIHSLINVWLRGGASNNKLVLGIPAFGRTWRIKDEKFPPFVVKSAGDEGSLLKIQGKMSYMEICMGLRSNEAKLVKVTDPTKRYGTYAYRAPDGDGKNGIWIGYDDASIIENKAKYVKSRGLGGMALFDITLDDFRGICKETYPLLNAIVKNLID